MPAIAGPIVHEGLAVPLRTDARIQLLEPCELLPHDVRIGRAERRRPERRTERAAGVEVEDSALARLRARCGQRLLEAVVGVGIAIVTDAVPEARLELRIDLR